MMILKNLGEHVLHHPVAEMVKLSGLLDALQQKLPACADVRIERSGIFHRPKIQRFRWFERFDGPAQQRPMWVIQVDGRSWRVSRHGTLSLDLPSGDFQCSLNRHGRYGHGAGESLWCRPYQGTRLTER